MPRHAPGQSLRVPGQQLAQVVHAGEGLSVGRFTAAVDGQPLTPFPPGFGGLLGIVGVGHAISVFAGAGHVEAFQREAIRIEPGMARLAGSLAGVQGQLLAQGFGAARRDRPARCSAAAAELAFPAAARPPRRPV